MKCEQQWYVRHFRSERVGGPGTILQTFLPTRGERRYPWVLNGGTFIGLGSLTWEVGRPLANLCRTHSRCEKYIFHVLRHWDSFFFLCLFIFERETETEYEWGRDRGRGRHKIRSRLQVLSCQHRARRGAQTHELGLQTGFAWPEPKSDAEPTEPPRSPSNLAS